MLTKSYTDIIKEASLSEDYNVTNVIADEIDTHYKECLNSISIADKDIVTYRAEMIPIFQNESSYYLELDNLFKYMKSSEIMDITEAMENIAEVNDIDIDDMALVIESKEFMDSIMKEAIFKSNDGDDSLLEDCELSIKFIDKLKSEGINVVLTK